MLIVGAGFLGRPLAAALAPEARVRTTTRSGTWPGDEAAIAGVELRRLDLVNDADAELQAITAEVDDVVLCHAAGRGQDRRAVYVAGAARLLAACPGGGVGRVVFTSSTSALPDVDGEVDEGCARWPEHERGRVMRAAEEAVLAGAAAIGADAWILRLGGLYGPGRGLARLYRSAPEAILDGDGMQATNLIHRDDALAAVLAALRMPVSTGGVVHVCDDDHRPRREMFARIAAVMGWPPPRWAEPATGAEVRGKVVSNRRLKELLGVSLRHPQHVLEDM